MLRPASTESWDAALGQARLGANMSFSELVPLASPSTQMYAFTHPGTYRVVAWYPVPVPGSADPTAATPLVADTVRITYRP